MERGKPGRYLQIDLLQLLTTYKALGVKHTVVLGGRLSMVMCAEDPKHEQTTLALSCVM